MGADYMLIPLMAAEQFGISSLSRAMAIILPANTIAQTWFPYFTSTLKQKFGNYEIPMYLVFAVAVASAAAIAMLPRPEPARVREHNTESLGLKDDVERRLV